jgi:arylformamidase
MHPEDYPAQEPLSAFAQGYAERLWQRAAAVSAEEVRYGADPYQSIALVRPERPAGPVLVFLHGGGWTSGYKEWNLFMAPQFAARGILFASIGYRLAPRALFPDMLADCIAGLRWLHRHAGAYGADPERLFIGGHSAGGHLSALLAASGHWQGPAGLPRGLVRGCLPVSGVYLFGEGSGLSVRPRFLGVPEDGYEAAASPLRQISAPLPPFFMAWGEKDFPHLVLQARAMGEALRAVGAALEQVELPGCNHLEAHLACGDPQAGWAGPALAFIERH